MFETTDIQKIHLYKIAVKMAQYGYRLDFISDLVKVGSVYEGVYDLATLWEEEEDLDERRECIKDIKEAIKENLKNV